MAEDKELLDEESLDNVAGGLGHSMVIYSTETTETGETQYVVTVLTGRGQKMKPISMSEKEFGKFRTWLEEDENVKFHHDRSRIHTKKKVT